MVFDRDTRDSSSPVWDMSQERAFTENLLNQRFSFFLVMFSLVIAGAINTKTQLQLQLLLTLGAVVAVMFASVLARSQEKLDLILDELFKDETHPVTIIDRASTKGGSRRRLIGLWIPRLCSVVLLLGATLAWCGCLRVPQRIG